MYLMEQILTEEYQLKCFQRLSEVVVKMLCRFCSKKFQVVVEGLKSKFFFVAQP